MQEFIGNFHFLRPWWLLALVLPIFFYVRYFRGIRNKSSWENVCDKKLLNFLLIKGSSVQRRILGFLGMSAFVAGIFAIAGPSWQKQEAPSMAPENPVMILLNLSSDMKEKDLTPSRLERAKYKIIDLLNGLKSAQSGLIVYTNEPFLITPLTEDKEIIINLLPAVNYDIMPSNGDRLDRAIDLAVEKFKNAGYFNGNIVIFSPDVGQRFDLALEAAKNAQNDKYAVSVLAVSRENNEKLKLISKYGGGVYENLSSSDRDVGAIDSFINTHISELKLSDNMQSTWKDAGYYLSIIPLLCCLYFFRRGIFVIALLLGVSKTAQAQMPDMFLNSNQQGYQAFSRGDFKTAAEKFEDANWKASALYRLGDYKAALKSFEQANDATGLYNQGNALAKGGKIPEAIKKYEEVLKLEPEHEDAKFNLEYLKRQQQQNQQNQLQNQQNNQQQQAQDNQQQSQNNQGDNQEAQNSPENGEQNQQEPDNKQQDQKDAQSGENQQTPQDTQQGQGQAQPQQGDESDDERPRNNQPQGASAEPQNEGDEERETNAAGGNEKEDGGENDEERQARIQKFREIPEDPGGLLKAFIAKEYRLNRYGDE